MASGWLTGAEADGVVSPVGDTKEGAATLDGMPVPLIAGWNDARLGVGLESGAPGVRERLVVLLVAVRTSPWRIVLATAGRSAASCTCPGVLADRRTTGSTTLLFGDGAASARAMPGWAGASMAAGVA
jgi:hypothetical protein